MRKYAVVLLVLFAFCLLAPAAFAQTAGSGASR